MPSKPNGAAVLSIIGGIIVLLVGVGYWIVGSLLTFFILGIGGIFGIWGIICGIIMIIGGSRMLSFPSSHALWGALVLIFSLLSWISLGGLFIGFILGFIGGIWGIVWRPSVAPAAPPSQNTMPNPQNTAKQSTPASTKNCPNCGATIGANDRFCPTCGKALP